MFYRISIFSFLFLLIINLLLIDCDKEQPTKPKNQKPEIISISANPNKIFCNQTSILKVIATDNDGDELTYLWNAGAGEFLQSNTMDSVLWKAPNIAGDYTCEVEISDGKDTIKDTVIIDVIVVCKVKGTIHFLKGYPPSTTDRIEVFAFKTFPPQYPLDFSNVDHSGYLEYNNLDMVDYEMQLCHDIYNMIGILGKEKNYDWSMSNLIGIYTKDTQFLPSSIQISEQDTLIDEINIYANWDIVNKQSHISGKIFYQGNWPQETSLLLLAIYQLKPTSEFTYLTYENIDLAQPIFVYSSSYRIAVNAGTYNYIVLYWVGENISKLSDMVEIGIYKNPDNPNNAGAVNISEGEEIENVNIYVDFNNF